MKNKQERDRCNSEISPRPGRVWFQAREGFQGDISHLIVSTSKKPELHEARNSSEFNSMIKYEQKLTPGV